MPNLFLFFIFSKLFRVWSNLNMGKCLKLIDLGSITGDGGSGIKSLAF